MTMTGTSRVAASCLDAREHLEAVHLRHHHVEEDEVERLRRQHLERAHAAVGGEHAVAEALEPALEDVAVVGVVVHDQHRGPRGPRRRSPSPPAEPGACATVLAGRQLLGGVQDLAEVLERRRRRAAAPAAVCRVVTARTIRCCGSRRSP